MSKVNSKYRDRHTVLGTKLLANRDRYKMLFGVLVTNRYAFATQIFVWSLNREKEGPGHHFQFHFQYFLLTIGHLFGNTKYMYTVLSEPKIVSEPHPSYTHPFKKIINPQHDGKKTKLG